VIFGRRANDPLPRTVDHLGMRSSGQPNRYVLVPRTDDAVRPSEAAHASPRVRRFSLARVSVSRRSALGVDRHERLEQIAGLGRRD
jgi:hypothetical protein